jgi:hypothetical protein
MFLVCQESLERSVAAGRPIAAAFRPTEIVSLLAALSLFAALVALLERSCVELATRVLAPLSRRLVALPGPLVAVARPVRVRRRPPLADHRGPRAPPAIA